MNSTFESTVGLMQVLLLGLWEAIGALYFGWSPVAILLSWGAGVFTFNIAVATALRTYIKLTTPIPVPDNVVNIADASVTEDDGVA